MFTVNVVMPVQDIWLVAVPHALHVFLDKLNHFLLVKFLSDCRIDACMKRHLLRPDTCVFILPECLHRVIPVLYV